MMAHDVFVSYSSPDKPIADAICATLEARKIRCWIAPRDVLPGMPYGEALSDAIATSRVLIVVLSKHSNESSHVMREVEGAIHNGVAILPFRIADVQPSKSLDYFLKSIHWLDALTPPLEKHLETLAETVRVLLQRQHVVEPGGPDAAPAAVASVAPPPGNVAAPKRTALIILAIGLTLGLAGGLWWAWTRPRALANAVPATPAASTPRANAVVAQRREPERVIPVAKDAPPQSEPDSEAAVRKAIERYYALLCQKDEAGVVALYSQAVAPTAMEKIQAALHRMIVDTGRIDVKQLVIDRIDVDGELAKAHGTVLLAATTVLTGEAYFPARPFVLTWDLVREDDGWKLLGYTMDAP
jgi:hypothetical protein